MVPPPSRIPVNAEIIQPLMVLLQQADEFIQSTTSTPDSVLGKRNPRAESGKAIQALQGQSEAANSSGIQNFADVTMQYEARVVTGMFKYVLDRAGRVEQVLNPQGEVRSVMLNAPFTMNGRRPVRAQGVSGQTTTMQPGAPPVKHYDLTTGYYGVSITVGKSLPTRVAQDSEQLAAIMEQDPELGVVLAPVFLRQQDGPGMKEAAILAKEYRDQKFGPMGEPKDGQPSPEQLMAKLKAAEGQIQQMQQAGTELQKQVETDQAKQLAMIEKAKIDASVEQMRIEAELKRAEMDNLARIQVAQLAAGARIDAEQIAAKVAMLIQGAKNAEEDKERQHEARLDLTARAHEAGMAIHDQERGSEEAQADRDHADGMAEGEHQRGMESAEHAASLEPNDEPEAE